MVKGQTRGDPALFTSHQGGDPALRQLVVIMKLSQEGRFLPKIPSTAMGPGENLHLDEGIDLPPAPHIYKHDTVAPLVADRCYGATQKVGAFSMG